MTSRWVSLGIKNRIIGWYYYEYFELYESSCFFVYINTQFIQVSVNFIYELLYLFEHNFVAW